jgi:hypothetical protein
MRRLLVLLALAGGAGPVALAQVPATRGARTCTVQADSVRRLNSAPGPAGQVQWFGGGGAFFRCAEDATRMTSDSFAWFPDRGELRLLGNVHFRDSTSLLDSNILTYWVRVEHLYAEGDVYTQNTKTKSDLRGPNLDYYRAVPSIRDTLELRASGRPTIRFYSARDTAQGDSAKPFVIVADRVHMLGNDRMWAGGRVTIDREALAAKGDSTSLDLGADRGYLIGEPEVASRDSAAYRLTGTRIAFDLTEASEIRRVVSQGNADARGTDWRLRADTLDMQIDSGRVQRAQAWGRNSRPVAVSGENTIVADSLDIHMPAQVVRLVWAYGRGRASAQPDSTAPDREEDWLSGDTLRANFAAPDTGANRRSELEHLTAFGSARALYHSENQRDARGPRGLNYSRGLRIDIALREAKVRTVDIVGLVDGVYLEPQPPRTDSTGADSTAADSTRAGAPAAGEVRADSVGAARADTTRAPARPGPADSARTTPRTAPDTTRTTPADTAAARPRPAAPPTRRAPRRPAGRTP